MNEHIELLVEVKSKTYLNAVKIILWIITVLGVLLALTGIFTIFPLIFAIVTGGAAYFIGIRAEREYEYSLTEKEIDIDVIYSKQNRKHITTLDLTKLEIMAPMDSSRLDGYKHRECKNEDYSSGDVANKKNMYVMYYEGSRRIVLEPDERLYKTIHNIAPHKVYNS